MKVKNKAISITAIFFIMILSSGCSSINNKSETRTANKEAQTTQDPNVAVKEPSMALHVLGYVAGFAIGSALAGGM